MLQTLTTKPVTTASAPSPLVHNVLQRKCVCGGAPGLSGECEECRKKRQGLSGGISTPNSQTSKPVRVAANQIPWERKDSIHGPMLEDYRESTGRVSGAPQVSDAALKYSGALGRANYARWTAPQLNPRDFAPLWFNRAALVGDPAGRTNLFLNNQKVEDELDAQKALPLPPIASRVEAGRTRGWFAQGVSATGHTVMDILSPGPWTHIATQAEVDTRLGREAQAAPSLLKTLKPCTGGTGNVTVRVTGEKGDAEMEEYIRKGEAEHDAVFQKTFEDNIGLYAANVNALIGGRPELELGGKDLADCRAKLIGLVNREALIRKFLLDANAANANVHKGGRHGVDTQNVTVDASCSNATVTLKHGKLTPLKP